MQFYADITFDTVPPTSLCLSLTAIDFPEAMLMLQFFSLGIQAASTHEILIEGLSKTKVRGREYISIKETSRIWVEINRADIEQPFTVTIGDE